MKLKQLASIVISSAIIVSSTNFKVFATELINSQDEVVNYVEQINSDEDINIAEENEDSIGVEVTKENTTDEVIELVNESDNLENDTKLNEDEVHSDEKSISSPKEVVNINEGWTITKEGKTSNINLPHSWEYTHPTMSYIPVMNQIMATYEKTIDISNYKDKNLFLKFYGVNKRAVIYVDGVKVDTHVGGFSTFVVDITDHINGDKDKVDIKVEVINIDQDTIPINTDFTHWAGIYRDVELVATDDIYISTEDYGTSGVYLDSNVDLKNNKATLDVKTAISHDISSTEVITVKAELKSADGNIVKTNETIYEANGNKQNSYVNIPTIKIDNPHLWNGTKDPYLYTVDVTLIGEDGNIIDKESQRVGFRTIEVSNDGFLLNGKVYKLNGVGFHQDREGYGNAVSKELKKEDLDMIVEMGANAIRTSHYPHEQYVYDLADEMGLIVWNEIPFYLIMADTEEFRTTTKQQLIEMIRQGYNHPSIAFWGIQNEVNTNKTYSQFGEQYNISVETLSSFMKELASLAKSEDSSRFVVQAHINGSEKAEESASWTKGNSDIDFTGFNMYHGWYENLKEGATEAGATTIGRRINNTINKLKGILGINGKVIISEYGAGANTNQHAEMNEDFVWLRDNTSGDFHPEEYHSFVHEASIKAIQENDDVLASFAWSMFDFSSYRNEGGQERLNDKGLVTYDRQTKKDAFYLYKANWNKDDKFVYLTSRRYTERTSNTTDIKVYSNCENVSLNVNGVDYGNGSKQQDGVFVWKNVKLSENNTIVATSIENGKTYKDTIKCSVESSVEKLHGWVLENDQWYYYDEDGNKVTGWLKDKEKWYYLTESGAMKTGWLKDKGKWYYLTESGAMKTGWQNDRGTWYYLDGSGAMKTGWLKDKGTWYYLLESGAMKTGWQNVDRKWYYLDESGAMKTGWIKDKMKWYYLTESGAMKTGWQNDNGKWYYLKEDGSMATATIIDGWIIGFDGVAKKLI